MDGFVAGALFIAFAAQLLRDAHRLHAKDREDEEVRALLGGDSGDSAQHGELLDAEETLQEVEQKEGGKVRTWWGVYQTFCLMFVAEWADKSMFATMALAAQHAPLGVICGAMCAHALANCVAVFGERCSGTPSPRSTWRSREASSFCCSAPRLCTRGSRANGCRSRDDRTKVSVETSPRHRGATHRSS